MASPVSGPTEPARPTASRAAKAHEAHTVIAAHRNADNPVLLGRAVRLVRAAIYKQLVSVEDLTPLPEYRRGGARQ